MLCGFASQLLRDRMCSCVRGQPSIVSNRWWICVSWIILLAPNSHHRPRKKDSESDDDNTVTTDICSHVKGLRRAARQRGGLHRAANRRLQDRRWTSHRLLGSESVTRKKHCHHDGMLPHTVPLGLHCETGTCLGQAFGHMTSRWMSPQRLPRY